jgi:predicted NBD/HSP70 family sugar kinase
LFAQTDTHTDTLDGTGAGSGAVLDGVLWRGAGGAAALAVA